MNVKNRTAHFFMKAFGFHKVCDLILDEQNNLYSQSYNKLEICLRGGGVVESKRVSKMSPYKRHGTQSELTKIIFLLNFI